MGNEVQALVSELAAMLDHHRLWWNINFWGAHIMFWLAIIASVFSALLVNSTKVSKSVVVAIAVVPAFVLSAESTFSIGARAAYHDEYIVEIERMLRSIRVEKRDPVTVTTNCPNSKPRC